MDGGYYQLPASSTRPTAAGTRARRSRARIFQQPGNDDGDDSASGVVDQNANEARQQANRSPELDASSEARMRGLIAPAAEALRVRGSPQHLSASLERWSSCICSHHREQQNVLSTVSIASLVPGC